MNTNELIWNGRSTNTVGGLMDALCSIRDAQEGANFMSAYEAHLLTHNPNWSRWEAVAAAKSNVGYVSRYADDATYRRIIEFTGGVHPIFGGVA